MDMLKKFLINLLLIIIPYLGYAQSSQTSDDPPGEQSSSSDAFNLVSAGYAGAGAAPKVNLKTYKFKALVGKSELDFYLFNSVPTIVPKLKAAPAPNGTEEIVDPSKRYLANDILQQVGGLLNVSLGKVAFFGYGKDKAYKYTKGFQTDFRLGAKMLEAPFETKSEFFPALHSFLDLRYLIPLVDPKQRKQGMSLSESMVGNWSFRILVGAQKFFTNTSHTDTYSKFFRTYTFDQNNDPIQLNPETILLSGNFESFFYLSNKIYLSAGYYYSNDKQIDSYPYFSISYGVK